MNNNFGPIYWILLIVSQLVFWFGPQEGDGKILTISCATFTALYGIFSGLEEGARNNWKL